MELSKNFDHNSAEKKWYQHWLDKKYFHSTPDNREPYTVVIPPPNVTGVLHMGHCLNNTIQDILVRRARMQGKNACWVPGTDHASIATEAKVVQMLREKGIQKGSLSRDEFLKYAWEWKENYGGIILQQLKKLGCSLDWERTTFTMDPHYYQSVISVFVDLFNKGYIYRGKRMINWDVKAKTALSDEEVIRKETQQKLYHLKYKLDVPGDEYIIIATVRPETIMGDTAICVHPNDERYKLLHGKYAFVPLINRRIPIITDDYVTMEFGTGALKVTPAHDMNDYQLGQKHQLEVIDIFNEDGTLNKAAEILIGEDRFEARKKIVKELEAKNHIAKIEDYTSEVGYSERTDVVVEPRLSLQWWVDMKKISGPALKVVLDDEIKFYPAKFKNLYRHWMENIKDWCISRQLWWGHRIPAWYDEDGNVYVANSIDELHANKPETKKLNLTQDEDCLDTWFSSWLWPFEVFKGYSDPDNKEVNYYYPTNTLVTAPEIIFFWVARMIMAGMEYKKEIPFREVYFTGIVRDKIGRKMSKQLGNSPDLLEMIDKDGADAVRFGIMISSPAGNDLMWDEAGNEQGRFFINKMWNALKLIKSWQSRVSDEAGKENFAVEWFENRLNEAKAEIDDMYKDFRLSEILKTIYSLIWDDFCSWYLEWIKPGFEQSIDKTVYEKTIDFYEQLMQLLHPFMPFITEEIYHELKERSDGLCVTQIEQNYSLSIIDTIKEKGEITKELIQKIREFRNKTGIKRDNKITVYPPKNSPFTKEDLDNRLKIVNAVVNDNVNIHGDLSYNGKSINLELALIKTFKFYLDLGDIETTFINIIKEKKKTEFIQELKRLTTFLEATEKKLNNERFVQNAKPEVIELERKKKADTEAKIKAIEESLATL
ncbi:MAG TPA: valine--tRNA ligase [Chitinophagaceae bacterium]|nr:valine--tRNA ligase [Chitinophagaceae bacterium]